MRGSESLRHYQNLFERLPVALWSEDLTDLVSALDGLRAAGVEDFRQYFAEHPALVDQLASQVKIIDANRVCIELFGARSKAELLGSRDKIFMPETYARFREHIAGIAMGETRFAHEAPARTLTGREIYIYYTVRLLPSQNGVQRGIVTVLDISQRRRIEAALRASQERYTELYENAPDMYASIDPRTLTILQCNKIMARTLGHDQSWLAGRSLFELIEPGFHAETRRALGQLTRTETSASRRIRLLRSSGEAVDASLRATVLRDPYGTVVCYSTAWRDISEQLRMQSELFETEKLYRTLTEAIPHMIWLGNASGKITYCNQAMVRATGQSLEQVYGHDWTEGIHPDERESIRTVQDAARRIRAPYRGECRFRAADGSYRVVHFIDTPVMDEHGQVSHWVGIHTDITELKHAQEQLQHALERSNTELAQFAYAASHDLQEPLRMVTSYSQLLEQRYADRLDADAGEHILHGIQGAKRIRKLIRDLLAISRVTMEAREQRPTDCMQILAHTLASMHQSISEAEARITYDNLPLVMADSAQLITLFQCLLSNSLKFRSEAAPQITIAARRDGAMWLFSVKDNGIGFDSAVHGERVFAMFERLQPSPTGGTGIGLTVARKIVERHGGRIWADSAPGRGTTIFFTLPPVEVELIADGRS